MSVPLTHDPLVADPTDSQGSQALRLRPTFGIPSLTLRRGGADKTKRGMGVSSLHLFASTLITNGLGYLYWIGAAHLFSIHTVGYVSVLISTMLLVTQVGSMGMGLGLAYILPDAQQRWSTIVNSVLIAVAFLAGGLSLAAVLAGTIFHLEIGTLVHSPEYLIAFVASSILWTVGFVLDQVFTIEKATGLVFLRNGLSSTLRLLLLPLLVLLGAKYSGVGLLGAWGLSALFSLLVVITLFARANPHGRRWRWHADHGAVSKVIPLALSNHVMMLLYFAPGLLLPLMVTSLVSVEANAYFYTTWMVATILFTVPASTSMSLFAHSAAQQSVTEERLRSVLKLTLITVIPLAAIVAGANQIILGLFGRQYAAHSGTLLIELAFASIPMSVCSVYISVQRIRRLFRRAFAAALLIPICCLGPTYFMSAHYGLDGVGAALGGGYTLVALFCVVELGVARRRQASTRSGYSAVSDNRASVELMLRMACVSEISPAVDNALQPDIAGRIKAPTGRYQPKTASAAVPPARHRWLDHFKNIAPIALTLLALGLWSASLHGVRLSHMTDIGLASVLPPATFAAIGLVILSFCLTLRQSKLREPIALFHVVALIVMLYGLTGVIETEPRFSSAWRHVGIIDYILRTGHLDPSLNAYFDWPGFFVANAFILRVAGFSSALAFVTWAPVFFEILYLGPLLILFNSATRDKRLVWLGIWFFYLTNWIGQDYFSPQAFAFFLHLTLIAVLVYYFTTLPTRWLSSGLPLRRSLTVQFQNWLRLWRHRENASERFTSPRQRAGLVAIIVLLFAVSVSSHQLTPFATLACIAALVLFHRSSWRGLPLVMLVVLGIWDMFVAAPYVAGHAIELTSQVGSVHGVMSRYSAARFVGSRLHALIVNLRVVFTLAIWALAFVGALLRWRHGWRDRTYVLLALAPFPLLGLQSYGGELLLRIYLFVLPLAALFMAAAFFTSPRSGRGWHTTILIFVVSLGLLAGFLLTRYGNERMDMISASDVNAVQQLYEDAAPESLIAVLSPNVPWQYTNLEKYHYLAVTSLTSVSNLDIIDRADVNALLRLMPEYKGHQDFLIITPSEKAELSLYYGVPSTKVDRFESALVASGRFRVTYDKGGAQILVRLPHPKSAKGVTQ